MDDSLDLWGEIETKKNAENVLILLKTQANLLEHKTEGKVKAVFEKIEYSYNNLAKAANRILKVGLASEFQIETSDNTDLQNAENLYCKEDYKFEIFNDKYKYRVFKLEYQPLYPINIHVEYGIFSDEIENKKISDEKEMIDILKKILSSEKVCYIIQKLKDN